LDGISESLPWIGRIKAVSCLAVAPQGHMLRNPNNETLNSNQCPNVECSNDETKICRPGVCFVIRTFEHSVLIRISNFVIRICRNVPLWGDR
jgi:hypothetical protein